MDNGDAACSKRLHVYALALAVVLSAVGVTISAALLPAQAAQAQPLVQQVDELSRRQVEAQRQRDSLRQRIESLQQRIDARESDRKEATDALRQSERAISEINRRLAELTTGSTQARTEINALTADIRRRSADLATRRDALSVQLRAQYAAAGLSPWSALLSGGDPQEMGRQLSYLDYVSKARAAEVEALRQEIERLETLRERERKRRVDLQGMQKETSQRRAELRKQQQARATVLARLEGQLKAQRTEVGRLDRDDQRLSGLVVELAQQVSAARQEETRRAAEFARQEAARLEQERLAAAKQQAQEAARQKAAQQQAAKQETSRQAAIAVKAQPKQAAQSAQRTARATTPASALKEGQGLRVGLPVPVRGKIVVRFASSRPDGGKWRGILLAAPEGTPVKVVAAGTVVYADWLRGFGNLIIIDHGQQFMTVYGHNQGLLKKVGDVVREGEVIATVGATGGQLESGLYFEVRHRSAPQDPSKFLRAGGGS